MTKQVTSFISNLRDFFGEYASYLLEMTRIWSWI